MDGNTYQNEDGIREKVDVSIEDVDWRAHTKNHPTITGDIYYDDPYANTEEDFEFGQ